jgi:hypothetical protein
VLWFAGAATVSLAGDPDENVVESFNVARHGDALILPVSIAGKAYNFIVDTGCTSCMVDESLRDKVAPTGRAVRINGRAGHAHYELRQAFVGQRRLPVPSEVIRADLSGIRECSGYDIRGVLGMAFLKNYVVQIDFDAGILCLLRSVPRSPGTRLELVDDQGCPGIFCTCGIDALTVFTVDTGLGGECAGMLDSRFLEKLLDGGVASLVGAPGSFVSFDGARPSPRVQISKYRVEDFEHSGVTFHEGPFNALGLNYLSRYIITLDFANRLLFLSRGKRYNMPTRFDMGGMQLSRDGDVTAIQRIATLGPAAACGLEPGDRLIEIDGRACSKMSLFEVDELFSNIGRHRQHVKLLLGRGTVTRSLDLPLWRWEQLDRPAQDGAARPGTRAPDDGRHEPR